MVHQDNCCLVPYSREPSPFTITPNEEMGIGDIIDVYNHPPPALKIPYIVLMHIKSFSVCFMSV